MSKHNLEIDLMTLFVKGDTKQWNEFLTKCFNNNDLQTLMNTRFGMQVGMTTLVKKKLNSDRIVIMYLRWQKSLELTAKKVLKRRHPLPGDDARAGNEDLKMDTLHIKKKRDNEFEEFLIRSSY